MGGSESSPASLTMSKRMEMRYSVSEMSSSLSVHISIELCTEVDYLRRHNKLLDYRN